MATPIKAVRRPGTHHPWDKWTDGRAWRARRGEDFTCTTCGFRSSLHSIATRRGLKVIVSDHGDAVEFQFSRPAKVL